MRPADFLVGIRDFFSILVPGAVFLMLLPTVLNVETRFPTPSSQSVFAFGVAAYLIGSVASGISAGLDFLVDPVLERKKLWIFSKKFEDRQAHAEELRLRISKDCVFGSEANPHIESTKSFWWSYFRLHSPAAITEMDRLEASQKLFRSLVPVFAALLILPHTGLAAYMVGGKEIRANLGTPVPVQGPHIASLQPQKERSLERTDTARKRRTPHPLTWLAGLVISALFYVFGRVRFSAMLFRLASAYCIKRADLDGGPESTA